MIHKSDKDLYINFNYTATLEKCLRNIRCICYTHTWFTQRIYVGHGNIARIDAIEEKQKRAEEHYNEKEISICRVVKDYYRTTFKDTIVICISCRELQMKIFQR